MGALIISIAAVATLGTAQPSPDPVSRWRPHIDEAAKRFGLPAPWIERVIRAESAGLTHLNGRLIRSSAGAMGLMQLMPATWATMRARLSLGADPDDPRDNILAGSFYLRMMHNRFGYPGLFGAYNLGPTGYARYLAGQRTLPGETVDYLAKIAGQAPSVAGVPAPADQPSMFIARVGSAPGSAHKQVPPSLFVVRTDAR